jgi:hypothetical protein
MTARSRAPRPRGPVVIVALAIVVAVFVWIALQRPNSTREPRADEALGVPSDAVSPANEGRLVRVDGTLRASAAARDRELGVSADAALLLRDVEMFQWAERCDGGACKYDAAWSRRPIASTTFREPAGHENPPLPFSSARFAANDLKLGAFDVDADALDARNAAPLAVKLADLPPNLRATFRAEGGALFAGNDASRPVVGDLRVAYRVVPLGSTTVIAQQRGTHLVSPSTNKD